MPTPDELDLLRRQRSQLEERDASRLAADDRLRAAERQLDGLHATGAERAVI